LRRSKPVGHFKNVREAGGASTPMGRRASALYRRRYEIRDETPSSRNEIRNEIPPRIRDEIPVPPDAERKGRNLLGEPP
jgi:hypothetical protein